MKFEYYNFEEPKKEIEEKYNLEKGFHISEDKIYQIEGMKLRELKGKEKEQFIAIKNEYLLSYPCPYEYDEDKLKKSKRKKKWKKK